MKTFNCFLSLLTIVLGIVSCNKNDKPTSPTTPTPTTTLSSDKEITYFGFKKVANSALQTDVDGIIAKDTIKLTVPSNVSLTNLNPTITYKGKSINPQNNVVQNFTNAITYMVTAEDTTTTKYVIIVKNELSNSKEISSFIFKANNNPGLTNDVTARIASDSIIAVMPNGSDLSSLVPSIVSTGASISPANQVAQNFSQTVKYTVTAQDGTTKYYKVYVTTAAAPGTVFINTLPESVINPGVGKVYAIDAVTGLLRWSYSAQGTNFVSTPAFYNGIVYTANWNKITAIDTITRKLLWEYATGNGVGSGLTIANSIVYANCNDGYMYAIDAKTGNLKWRFAQHVVDTIHGNSSSPTVVNGVVYFGSSKDEYVYALDAATGILKWETFNTYGYGGGIFQSGPSVVNGVVYIGDCNRNLLAIDANSGVIKWVFSAGGLIISSPTVVNGIVYFGSTDGVLYAINAIDGTRKWTHWSPPQIISSPIVSQNIVFYGNAGGSSNHGFWALDANTGDQKWVYTFGTDFQSSPVVLDGTVYIPNYNTLLALDVANGNLKWSFVTDDPHEEIYAAPCIVDQKGNVYHSSISGNQQ